MVSSCLRPLLSAERCRRIERVLVQRLVSVTVVLENPYDPHNGAAVLRSCEAFGLLQVHVIDTVGRPFSFSRKVTQDAHKWLDVHQHPSVAECFDHLQGAGFRCWGAVPPKAGRPSSSRLEGDRPLALILGNEHSGLSAEAIDRCDALFHLPMYGFSESLNLSVSAALAVREATDLRRRSLQRTGDLPAHAIARMRAAYYARSVRHADRIICAALMP